VTGLTEQILEGPAARAWLDGVARALEAGRSVFAVFPSTVAAKPVLERVVVAAERGGLRVVDVEVTTFDPAISPLVALAVSLGLDGQFTVTMPEGLVGQTNAPDVLCVSGIEELSAQRQAEWVALTKRLAHAAARAGRCMAVLCPIMWP
jgi:hypothetical protein